MEGHQRCAQPQLPGPLSAASSGQLTSICLLIPVATISLTKQKLTPQIVTFNDMFAQLIRFSAGFPAGEHGPAAWAARQPSQAQERARVQRVREVPEQEM